MVEDGIVPKAKSIPKAVVKTLKQPVDPLDWRSRKRTMILNSEVSKFTKAFKENFATLIISALGVVAALSWNDAIKAAIDAFFPSTGNLVYKFYVAIMVTVLSVIITYFLSRIKNKQ
jgi:hypothetical protein